MLEKNCFGRNFREEHLRAKLSSLRIVHGKFVQKRFFREKLFRKSFHRKAYCLRIELPLKKLSMKNCLVAFWRNYFLKKKCFGTALLLGNYCHVMGTKFNWEEVKLFMEEWGRIIIGKHCLLKKCSLERIISEELYSEIIWWNESFWEGKLLLSKIASRKRKKVSPGRYEFRRILILFRYLEEGWRNCSIKKNCLRRIVPVQLIYFRSIELYPVSFLK